ncbi:glycosyltransferase family 2 protein [Thermosporothrix hazakensis]|jgi:GT2 family glycosyltransferase|uniref:glycosyltransferase family 2 protein n=1 Tax=Thermosporothrix hazakensis TaxID=644383 RepID=UPI000DAED636|nr:glycosyltransferase family 2 protein [Thermosporothrix hazakensis]
MPVEEPQKADVSVVICTYSLDRWQPLQEAIASVRRQTLPAREIIVVSDHNQTLYQQLQASMPDIQVVENHHAPGLSGARNTGLDVARGSVIAFLDDDAIATTSWLAQLIEGFTDPTVAATGGSILPLWPGQTPRWFPEEFYWVVGCTYRGMPEQNTIVRNVIGANMAFRKEVLKRSGGFRSHIGRIGTLPLGCEETELCIRVQQQQPGMRCLYQPEARVYHRVPQSRIAWKYFVQRCFAEGISKAMIARFVGQHASLATEQSYTFRLLLGIVPALLIRSLLHCEQVSLQKALTILAGIGAAVTGYLYGSMPEPMLLPYQQRGHQVPTGRKDQVC